MNTVAVEYAVARRGLPAAASFRAWVGAALGGAPRRPLSLRVVGTAEGRRINKAWRGKDHATNVLSFPAAPMRGVEAPPLGDIVLCAPVVAREAREQGKAARAHWAHLTVHGVLHLVGHDHEHEAEATRMERLERRILADLGFPDPYADE